MKKFLLALLALLLIGVGVLWVMGKDTRAIATEVEIAAPPAEVWAQIADINGWSDWNPSVTKTSGKAAMGETLDITITAEDGTDGPNYKAVIVELDEPKTLRWRAKMMNEAVFKNDRIFTLEPTETGTRLTHSEEFSGLMVPMMWGFFETGVPTILGSMNEALKATLETSQ